jgi:hypothetical protein
LSSNDRSPGRPLAALALSLGLALGAACGPGGAAESEPARSDCVTCHLPDYASASHHEGVRPTRCEVCHTSASWHPTVLEHEWPLTGAHKKLAKNGCFECHGGKPPVFEGTPKACVECHRDKLDPPPFPAHAHFAATCGDCHTTDAWKPTLPHVKPAPSASAAPAAPVVTAPPPTAAPTATTPAPKPTATIKPAPKPTPKPTPTPTPTPKPPDVWTGPSPKR